MAETIHETGARYFPFNSVSGDRIYNASDQADFMKLLYSNGVFVSERSIKPLQILATGNGLELKLSAGQAFINGYLFPLWTDYIFTLPPAGLTTHFLEAILRLDLTARGIYFVVRDRISNLVRNDDIWELKLADITLIPGITTITQSDITDTRLDDFMCGTVAIPLEHFDLTDLYNQYMSWFSGKKEEWQNYTSEQIVLMQENIDQFQSLLQSLQSQSFILIDNNFDNLSNKPGISLSLTQTDENTTTEEMRLNVDNTLVALRSTSFYTQDSNRYCKETTTFYTATFIVGVNTYQTTDTTIVVITNLETLVVTTNLGAPSSGLGTLSGAIINSNLLPVSFATLKITDEEGTMQTVISHADGIYTATVAAGYATISYDGDFDYYPFSIQVNIIEGIVTSQNVNLNAVPDINPYPNIYWTFRILFVWDDTGEPVPDYTINLTLIDDGDVYSYSTGKVSIQADENGRLILYCKDIFGVAWGDIVSVPDLSALTPGQTRTFTVGVKRRVF